MKKNLTFFFLLASSLLSPRAEAIVGAGTVASDNSGVITFVGISHTCTGVLITNDLILTAKSCFTDSEIAHPILLGYFMGSQDSERNIFNSMKNPVLKIKVHPSSDLALVQLTTGLSMNGMTTGFVRRLYPFESVALPGTSVLCQGYGTTGSTSVYQYANNKLSSMSFTVTGASGGFLSLNDMSRFALYDLGGPCLASVGGELMVAGLLSGTGGKNPNVVSVPELRTWVNQARLFHELTPGNGSKVATIENASPDEGAKIVLKSPTGAPSQRWDLDQVSNDVYGRPYYELHVRQTNQCMAVADASLSPGWRIIQWPCSGDITDPSNLAAAPFPEQIWRIDYQDHGYSQLVNYNSGLCLDASSTALQQAKCDTQLDAQRWRINAVYDADGVSHHLRSSGGVCAQPDPSGSWQVQSLICNGSDAQNWKVMPAGGTLHTFISGLSSQVLDVSGSLPDAAPILVFPPNGGANQLWRLEWRPSGYALKASHTTDRCAGTPTAPGAVDVWQGLCFDPSPNQAWWID